MADCHDRICRGYDSAIHISEEASNAATAVPKAIVGAIGLSGILGTAVMITLAFCMGTNLDAIMQNSVGQPVNSHPYPCAVMCSSQSVLDGGNLLPKLGPKGHPRHLGSRRHCSIYDGKQYCMHLENVDKTIPMSLIIVL
jgi:hypothetical protein